MAAFYNAYEGVREILEQKLEAESGRGLKIWLTGHSLGGALATLSGTTVMDRLVTDTHYDLVGVYSFGQLRVTRRSLCISRAMARLSTMPRSKIQVEPTLQRERWPTTASPRNTTHCRTSRVWRLSELWEALRLALAAAIWRSSPRIKCASERLH